MDAEQGPGSPMSPTAGADPGSRKLVTTRSGTNSAPDHVDAHLSPKNAEGNLSPKNADAHQNQHELAEALGTGARPASSAAARINHAKSKKLIRTASLQKFHDLIASKSESDDGNNNNNQQQSSAAAAATQPDNGKLSRTARQPSLRMMERRRSQEEFGSKKMLAQSLSAFRFNQETSLIDADAEQQQQQHLPQTASQLRLPDEDFRVIKRGNSMVLIPKEETLNELQRRNGRPEHEFSVAKDGTVIAKKKEVKLGVKYKRMIGEELAEPPLYLSSYGQGRWWIDVFSFYHNAFRREMQDMYYMLNSMNKRYSSLTQQDVQLFFDWFDVFAMFIEWYFKMEEIVLFPWVEERLMPPDELVKVQRLQVKAKVVEYCKSMDSCLGKFDYLPYGEVLPDLIDVVGHMVAELLGYFRREEKQLCPMIQEAYSESDKFGLDERCIDILWNSDESGMILEWLVRPVHDDRMRREIRQRYLAHQKGIKNAFRRRAYNQTKKDFIRDHQKIVGTFYEKLNVAFVQAEKEEFGF